MNLLCCLGTKPSSVNSCYHQRIRFTHIRFFDGIDAFKMMIGGQTQTQMKTRVTHATRITRVTAEETQSKTQMLLNVMEHHLVEILLLIQMILVLWIERGDISTCECQNQLMKWNQKTVNQKWKKKRKSQELLLLSNNELFIYEKEYCIMDT